MVQVRQVLAKHWRELQGEPAEDAASSHHQSSAATLLTNAFHLVKPGQARYCGVYSNKFSLLRKRHMCRTCCASVRSKCATTTKRRGFGPGDRSGTTGSSSDRECTLCIQFSDETADSCSSASASHRNFVIAMSSPATESATGE